MSVSKSILDIKNLSLHYDKKKIFKELNFAILKNSITAISGPSGVGKSSLLHIINQIIREDKNAKVAGEVLFHGERGSVDTLLLEDNDLPALRKKIVYVSQHPDILPFSIFDNVAFGLKLQCVKKADAKPLIIEALKSVFLYEEVKDRLNVSANVLSGGQQQRLILARALVLKPEVLLLDEPTASLNEEVALKIENLLLSLKQERSIVIISHFKEQVLRVADRIFELCP